MQEKRLGVVGIVLNDRDMAQSVNYILGGYAHIIIGRMGLPRHGDDSAVISLIVEGTTDEIGAMTGKLGNLNGVNVKSALTAREKE